MDPFSLLPRHEIERQFSIENGLDKAAGEYARSPLDAEGYNEHVGHTEAVSKFEEALNLEPRKHYTQWCLGTAYTTQGFLMPDGTIAYPYFKTATRCFQDALDQDQDNLQYLQSLEMSIKAPSMYHEMQKQAPMQKGSSKLAGAELLQGSKRKKLFVSTLKYDLFGWATLALGIAAWVHMVKSSGFPTPPVT